mmetsp:Transcript_46357/g.110381  ORF Transcript_46357/g.110381 Transcript_46357/m.110381 type:complete len:281 (-) Transcript_46357:56-898(-)
MALTCVSSLPVWLAATFFLLARIATCTHFEQRGDEQLLGGHASTNSERLNIRAYVECMCPDCRQWVETVLKPVWTDAALRQTLELQLLPFGNAAYNLAGSLSCQHGEKECDGNMAMTCAGHVLATEASMGFAFCLMDKISALDADSAVVACTTSQDDVKSINDCRGSALGQRLMSQMAEATKASQQSYTPWITVNGRHSVAAEKDLKKLICDTLTSATRPASCASVALVRNMQAGSSMPIGRCQRTESLDHSSSQTTAPLGSQKRLEVSANGAIEVEESD